MAVTDPIADFMTRIKNAGAAGRQSVVAPYSKVTLAIAEVLKREGYIADVTRQGRGDKRRIEVMIRYREDGDPAVHEVKRVSKPSRRMYTTTKNIRPVRQGHGTMLLSTPTGVMTGDEARKQGVGGEVLFEIW